MELSNQSYWMNHVKINSYESLKEDIECDAVIIGGGLTGITTAFRLQRAGLKTVVIEKSGIGSNASGHTTAKISSQHGLIYSYLKKGFGREQALQYARANEGAIDFIKGIVKEYHIDCNLEDKTALIYTNLDEELNQYSQEFEACKKLGLDVAFIDKTNLPFSVKGAIALKNQAQFHPLKYLYRLAEIYIGLGGKIFEDTTALSIDRDEKMLITESGKVRSDYFVIATHYPFYDKGHIYYSKMAPYTSYITAVKANGQDQNQLQMYISKKPRLHSYRIYEDSLNQQTVLLAGGCNHKTGQLKQRIDPIEDLKADVKSKFNLEGTLCTWGLEDYITIDRVPYIGRLIKNNENIFVATGFGKWGMTTSALSGQILEDLIIRKKTDFSLFDPSRNTTSLSIKTIIVENGNASKEYIKSKLQEIQYNINELKVNEGSVFKINGQKVGVYRDMNGMLHGVGVICPHMKATLVFNQSEKTWDCPCHGSRFNYKGERLDGPSDSNLEVIDLGVLINE